MGKPDWMTEAEMLARLVPCTRLDGGWAPEECPWPVQSKSGYMCSTANNEQRCSSNFGGNGFYTICMAKKVKP